MDSSEETVKVIMSEVDADGSGEVDFGEFCQTILRPTMSKYTVYEVQSAFEDLKSGLSQHEIDGSSRIHRDTAVFSALRNFGPKLSKKEADQVCDDLNPEANGDIDYDPGPCCGCSTRAMFCAKSSHGGCHHHQPRRGAPARAFVSSKTRRAARKDEKPSSIPGPCFFARSRARRACCIVRVRF